MKNRLGSVAGPLLFLAGTLSFALCGVAIADSLRTLVADSESGPKMLASLPVAMGSLVVIAMGIALARFSSAPYGSQSGIATLLALGSGAFVAIGAGLCGWSVSRVVRGFDVMTSADTLPKSEMVEFTIGLAEPFRMLGSALLLLSAVLALADVVVELRRAPTEAGLRGSVLGGILRWVSAGVGAIIILLSAYASLRAGMLRRLFASDIPPSLNQWYGPLLAVLDASWYAFLGLFLLGVLELSSALSGWQRKP